MLVTCCLIEEQSYTSSLSFWPLLIIESVACVSQHMLFIHDCALSKYNAKCKLDCFNFKMGFFIRLFTSMFRKEGNYNQHLFVGSKSNLSSLENGSDFSGMVYCQFSIPLT